MCEMRMAVLASVLAGLLLLVALPASASAGMEGWQYQREIAIQENSGETLRDYQVLVVLDGGDFPEEAEADGGDIRFTDADENELSYWIEEFDAGSNRARIWVKMPLIPANGEARITTWYGNPGAASESGSEAVFEFFDDFEAVSLDTDEWSTFGTASVSGGNVLIGTSGGQDAQILTIPSYNKEKIVEVRAMGISGYHNNFFVGGSRVSSTNYGGAVRMGWDTIDIEHEPMSSIYDARTSYVSDLGIWYRFQTAVHGDIITAKVKLDTLPTWEANVSHRYPSGTLPSTSQIALVTDNSYSKLDWIRIRSYTPSEPTITLAPPAPAAHTALTITKSPTTHSIRQFQETTITISIENSGITDATDIEITDAIHPSFDLTSGDFPNPLRYDLIRPGETRDLQYTLTAKEGGTFTLDPATVTYADEDGNIQEALSEPASIKVIPSTEGGTSSGTSRSNPAVSTASVQLHGEKTDVVLGDFDVNGRIIYYFGDDRDDFEDHMLTLPITVLAEPDASAEQAADTSESEGSSTPGFAAVVAIVGLLAVYSWRKRV
ncbi:MAG: DUF2341 domain-containing protein [Euryarchaeota archaeon]|nr:MAG: hypothetical protein C5S47_06250 [ANME-2 cluster archaeon]MEA1863839.1 DUF2341 domain-containing protein [Euryarchaeota archaeon]